MATRSQQPARRLSTARRRTAVDALAAPPSRSRSAPRHAAPRRLSAPLPPLVLGHYPFVGPFARWEKLEQRAGILAIVERSAVDALLFRPVFITEADNLREAMAKLQAKSVALSTHRTEPVAYAALYTDVAPAARRQILAELRARYQLPAVLLTVPPSSSLRSTTKSARHRSLARRRGG